MPNPELPEGLEQFYLVECGRCGFIGDASAGHCMKCCDEGEAPGTKALNLIRETDLPAIRAQAKAEERERLRKGLMAGLAEAVEKARSSRRKYPGEYVTGYWEGRGKTIRELLAIRAALDSEEGEDA